MDILPVSCQFLLEPISPEAPCGDDLEYDPQYMELFIRIVPKEKKTIGGGMGSERLESEFEPVRWSEVERDCLTLLRRTRDIRLLTVWLRCRTQQAQAQGLRQGLFVLERLLAQWPSLLYPLMETEGEEDLLPRADALLAIAEPQGLLADIRALPVCGSGGLRLEVRDVERAFSLPLAEDAISPEAMRHRLNELGMQNPPDYAALQDSLALARSIDALAHEQLGVEAPDLSRLLTLLGRLEVKSASLLVDNNTPRQKNNNSLDVPIPADSGSDMATGNPYAAPGSEQDRASAVPDSAPGALPGAIANRHVARERIRDVRLWFEEHEPSSPVSLLLRQAEQLIGKRFADVVDCLPQDLLQKWENE